MTTITSTPKVDPEAMRRQIMSRYKDLRFAPLEKAPDTSRNRRRTRPARSRKTRTIL